MNRILILALFACGVQALAMSPLHRRGYTVMPEPQKVELEGGDFELDGSWSVSAGAGGENARESLIRHLADRYGLNQRGSGAGKLIELAAKAGSVETGEATDRDRAALAAQAYRLELRPDRIRITANTGAGLFYGVQTLVQLVRADRDRLWLPQAEILDWPDLSLREVFWDNMEHLDRFEVLKQAIDRAAFFKVNAMSLRLNGHFQYKSAPALVDPYALTPSQLQELTDYALRRYIQLIPYIDGPAHTNYILERDEYKHLREFPENAFQMCSTNPETYRLLQGIAQDLMNANKGVKYFHLSTDEAWFIGKAEHAQCNEAARAKELGSPSKLWVEFTQKMAGYLEKQGRTVIFWAETPLQAEDIPRLSPALISGELFSAAYNKALRARGIRQMIYTNSQPLAPLVPAYYVLAPGEQVHAGQRAYERAAQVYNEISFTAGRKDAEITGAGVYAWGDTAPHPETFWLGYATGASAAWHPGSTDPAELADRFYRLFYGSGADDVARVYQLLSRQAQFFGNSWDSEVSDAVPLVFGYSYGIGPFTQRIQTLPLPPIPSADYLRLGRDWGAEQARRLELAWKFRAENDELLDLLYRTIRTVQWNRHNLEVYLSLAKVCRQNLDFLIAWNDVAGQLASAQEEAAKLRAEDAVGALDRALDVAVGMRDRRNQLLREIAQTWYETWQPRVREANGRRAAREPQRFVDTAPSEGARRAQEDFLYVLEREFLLPVGDWFARVQEVRNRYAAKHKLPARDGRFEWHDTATMRAQAIDREL